MSIHVTLTHYTLNKYFLHTLQRKPVPASKTSPIVYFFSDISWLSYALSWSSVESIQPYFKKSLVGLGYKESQRVKSNFTFFFFFNFKIEPFYVQNNGPNSNMPGLECRKHSVDKRIIDKIISSALKRS